MMRKYFRPKEDITAYELAYVVGHMSPGFGSIGRGLEFLEKQWEDVPEGVRHHFSSEPE